jgi:CubicO group peptidase (beta-lactamase class C family)
LPIEHSGGAFGWDGGFRSSWLVDPVGDLMVIVLTQRHFECPDPPRVPTESGLPDTPRLAEFP